MAALMASPQQAMRVVSAAGPARFLFASLQEPRSDICRLCYNAPAPKCPPSDQPGRHCFCENTHDARSSN